MVVVQKQNNMKKGSTFKMKGFKGFGNSPVKKVGSTLENTKNKKKTDRVVNPDTKVVTDVATQRLIDAKAPKEVIEKSRDKFIAREKAKNQKKKSPAKAGQTAGQIVRRERLMT